MGLQEHQLREIEQNYPNNSHRKTEVLRHWLENAKNPNWKAVFNALRQMGEHRVALNIKKKYSMGMCLFIFWKLVDIHCIRWSELIGGMCEAGC